MLTKLITPIFDELCNLRILIGTQIDYRLFGLLIYRKRMITPAKYGMTEYDYQIRF